MLKKPTAVLFLGFTILMCAVCADQCAQRRHAKTLQWIIENQTDDDRAWDVLRNGNWGLPADTDSVRRALVEQQAARHGLSINQYIDALIEGRL